MDGVTTSRSPRRRDTAGRREELVEAGARVVAREGVAAATTRRIADEAGVPQGLVHYWFADKNELLEEVVETYLRGFEAAALASAVDAEAADSGAEADYVLERLRAAFDVVRNDDPGRQIAMYELTTWALRTPESRDIARRQYAAYRATAARLSEHWLERHGDTLPASAHVLAQLLSALFDGVVLAWLADPETADPDAVFTLVSQLLAHKSG